MTSPTNTTLDSELIQIPKPQLGRPNDSRMTAEYIAARPELSGVKPFDPSQDVDLVDATNDALGKIHALVAYADPALRDQMAEELTESSETRQTLEQVTARNSLLPTLVVGKPAVWQGEVAATQAGMQDPNVAGLGWLTPVLGQAINRVTIWARAYGATSTTRVINWAVRSGSNTGALLASGTVNLVLSTDAYLPVVLDYTGGVYPANTALYVMVWSDSGPLDIQRGPDGAGSAASQRYNPNSKAWEVLGAQIIAAARYELVALDHPGVVGLSSVALPLVVDALARQAPAPVLLGDVARLGTTSPSFVDYNDWIDAWSWFAPSVPACRYIAVDAAYWHDGHPLTSATLTVRDGSQTGPVLAHVTTAITPLGSYVNHVVWFDLGDAGITAGDKQLELTFNSRASVVLQQTNPSFGGTSYQRNSGGQFQVTGTTFSFNARFYASGALPAPTGATPLIKLIDSRLPQPPRLIVPPRLYGVVGEQITAYLNNLLYWDWGEGRSKYRAVVGNMPSSATFHNGRFNWTPNQAGSDGFNLEIYDEANHLVWAKWIQLPTVAVNTGSGSTTNILPFTDSHGYFGVMLGMIRHMFNDVWGGRQVNFYGTQRVQRTWDGKSPGSVYAEAYPGTNIRNLYESGTLAGQNNPWRNNGTFDFAYGMSKAPAWKLVDGDVVLLLHGTNTAPLERIDTAILHDMDLYEDFAAQVHRYNKNLKVVLGTTIPHALAPGDHDGRWLQHFAAESEAITKRFDNRTGEGIYVLPHGPTLHRVADFPQITSQRTPWGIPQIDYSSGNVASTSAPPTDIVFADTTHPRDPGTTELAGTGGGYRPLGHALAMGLKNLLG